VTAQVWKVEGKDGFDPEADYYPLSEHPSPQQALTAALERLAELSRAQPGAGGQDGIQDRVYVVHPGGRRERIFAARQVQGRCGATCECAPGECCF
jgi:hypothetical protein